MADPLENQSRSSSVEPSPQESSSPLSSKDNTDTLLDSFAETLARQLIQKSAPTGKFNYTAPAFHRAMERQFVDGDGLLSMNVVGAASRTAVRVGVKVATLALAATARGGARPKIAEYIEQLTRLAQCLNHDDAGFTGVGCGSSGRNDYRTKECGDNGMRFGGTAADKDCPKKRVTGQIGKIKSASNDSQMKRQDKMMTHNDTDKKQPSNGNSGSLHTGASGQPCTWKASSSPSNKPDGDKQRHQWPASSGSQHHHQVSSVASSAPRQGPTRAPSTGPGGNREIVASCGKRLPEEVRDDGGDRKRAKVEAESRPKTTSINPVLSCHGNGHVTNPSGHQPSQTPSPSLSPAVEKPSDNIIQYIGSRDPRLAVRKTDCNSTFRDLKPPTSSSSSSGGANYSDVMTISTVVDEPQQNQSRTLSYSSPIYPYDAYDKGNWNRKYMN